jgi:spermidine synthase
MNAPYALFPVVLLVLVAYFFSLLLTKWKILQRERHYYYWNILLLLTFTVSSLLGLLAVIKINYQLTIPHYEEILRLHIHVGIGMVIIAFLHLFRHLRYYFAPVIKKNTDENVKKSSDQVFASRYKVLTLLFLLGFISFTSQLVLIREFISVFTGNELVIGFFLSLWLILTGTGARAARSSGRGRFTEIRLQMLILFTSVLPLLIIFLLYWFKSTLFPPGTAPGPLEILCGTAFLLFPLCFLSGYLFVVLTGIESENQDKNMIARSYIVETIGSLSGGICFSFLFVFIFRSLEILAIIVFLTGIVITIQGLKYKQLPVAILTSIMSLVLLVLVFALNLDTRLKSVFFANQKMIFNKSDFTGNLVVTDQEGQLNFYTNNNLDYYTNNIIDIEESAHYAMVQKENPQKVLIISGDALAIAQEIMKYNVLSIDIIMPTKQYYLLSKQFAENKNTGSRIHTMTGDPVRFLQKKPDSLYDVIILNTPPPSTLKDNRFYTTEFLLMLKKHCSAKSVISLQLPSTSNYAGPEALELNSMIYNTLRSIFKEVRFIPGEKNYYLASESYLNIEIASAISAKGLETKYINKNYINDHLLKERSETLLKALNTTAPVNTMLNPRGFLLHLSEWLRMYGTFYRIFAAVPLLIMVLAFFRQTPVRAGLMISGFSASSLQILLIIGFQLFYGNIFYQVSLFFAVFLSGLASGTFIGGKQPPSVSRFNYRQLGLAGLSLVTIALFTIFLKFPVLRNFVVLFHMLNAAAAFFLGYQFSQAAGLEKNRISARTSLNYTADLVGSALGTYITSIFLIPVFGMVNACLVTAGASLSGFIYVYLRQKKYD